MSRSSASSRSASSTKSRKVDRVIDIDKELLIRTISLFISHYGISTYEDIPLDFAVPQKKTSTNKDKFDTFDSPIIEYRLRKIFERKVAQYSKQNEAYTDELARMSRVVKNKKKHNLDPMFQPKRAERPETPKYIVLQEIDRHLFDWKPRKPQGIDMASIQSQFRAKLRASKQRGIERFRERQRNNEAIVRNTLSVNPEYTYKTEVKPMFVKEKLEAETAVFNRRSKYQPDGGYKSLVKTVSPRNFGDENEPPF